MLRLEALGLLALNLVVYARIFPGHWGLFALLFLVPDVGLILYMIPGKESARVWAAHGYNLMHFYGLPLLLGAAGWFLKSPAAEMVALIWLAHISFDRAVGYGLKYGNSFKVTHLQVLTSKTSPETGHNGTKVRTELF